MAASLIRDETSVREMAFSRESGSLSPSLGIHALPILSSEDHENSDGVFCVVASACFSITASNCRARLTAMNQEKWS